MLSHSLRSHTARGEIIYDTNHCIYSNRVSWHKRESRPTTQQRLKMGRKTGPKYFSFSPETSPGSVLFACLVSLPREQWWSVGNLPTKAQRSRCWTEVAFITLFNFTCQCKEWPFSSLERLGSLNIPRSVRSYHVALILHTGHTLFTKADRPFHRKEEGRGAYSQQRKKKLNQRSRDQQHMQHDYHTWRKHG